ncbi:MAG TPA: hypothetical protein VGN01_08465 [Acidobacteriaceae bacterium]
MPADYADVLKDLDRREKALTDQLAILRAARPAIFALKQQQELESAALTPSTRFQGMGATKAIPLVLKDAAIPMTTSEVLSTLKEGGWTTNAQSPLGTVSATLGQLRDVEKVGDRWRLKLTARVVNIPMNHDGPTYIAAQASLVADATTESWPPSEQ